MLVAQQSLDKVVAVAATSEGIHNNCVEGGVIACKKRRETQLSKDRGEEEQGGEMQRGEQERGWDTVISNNGQSGGTIHVGHWPHASVNNNGTVIHFHKASICACKERKKGWE